MRFPTAILKRGLLFLTQRPLGQAFISLMVRRRKTNTLRFFIGSKIFISLFSNLVPKIDQKPKRFKSFKVRPINNVNLFEGLPLVGYEGFIKKGLILL